ncbi:MAG: molybdopterin-dependent oxidoreductase [Acidobacteriaceae bacterium]
MRGLRWGVVAGLVVGLSLGAWAQATVTVVVKDPSGAAVPRARVEIRPDSGAAVSILNSDARGQLQTTLDSGGYDLQVSAPGFLKKDQPITVSGSMRIAVVLGVAQTANPEITITNPTRALVTEEPPDAGQSAAGAPAAGSDVLVIEAGPGERGVFTAASLREYPQTKETVFDHHANKNETYAGVPLMDLLAHLGMPHGKDLMGKALAQYVVATGSDGYTTVLSLGEIDPAFHPGVVLVADELDGKPLDAKTGPFRLVVSEDKKAARSVRNLVKIEVKTAGGEPGAGSTEK